METLPGLIQETEEARQRFIAVVSGLSFEQVNFKPDPDTWSITEITEHITRAEQSGTMFMFKALDGYKRGQPVWSGDLIHKGLPIEEVIDKTWQPKEKVPEIAAPSWGGSIAYWIALLKAQTHLLKEFGIAMNGYDLEAIVIPHLLSGPLDIRQRLEFLRFHLDRHRNQVERVKQHPDYPKTV